MSHCCGPCWLRTWKKSLDGIYTGGVESIRRNGCHVSVLSLPDSRGNRKLIRFICPCPESILGLTAYTDAMLIWYGVGQVAGIRFDTPTFLTATMTNLLDVKTMYGMKPDDSWCLVKVKEVTWSVRRSKSRLRRRRRIWLEGLRKKGG